MFAPPITNNIEKISEAITPANLLKAEIDQMANLYNIIIEFFTNYSFQLTGALIIFSIDYVLAGKRSNFVLRLCQRHKLDIMLSQFLASTTKMLIVIMIAIISLSKLGISVTPFIAAISAISLGPGLALQGVTGVVEEMLLALRY
jgi:small conductance mechanosensitive channel